MIQFVSEGRRQHCKRLAPDERGTVLLVPKRGHASGGLSPDKAVSLYKSVSLYKAIKIAWHDLRIERMTRNE